MVTTIGNPLTWVANVVGRGSGFVREGTGEIAGKDTAPIVVNRLRVSDLKLALRKGVDDLAAFRTDVLFIVVIYPIIGMLLIGFALNSDRLPLLFPLVSGFALLGPVAAIGLYQMSRKRELGQATGWGDAFGIMGSPSLFPIVALGFYLFAIFCVWMLTAQFLYDVTLGPEPPISSEAFLRDTLTSSAGLAMLISGTCVGFFFAVVVLAISFVSFPLLVDRHVGLARAVVTSFQIVWQNPLVAAVWGGIVVVGLGVGVATLFVGLVVVLPVLGHATWHLYRRAVAATP